MIQPKFKIGQKVYTVVPRIIYKAYECDLCGGDGTVTAVGKKEISIRCPVCSGMVNTIAGYKYIIQLEGVQINGIHCEELDTCENRITYLFRCNDTYINFLEEYVFTSKQEAEDFCRSYTPLNLFGDKKKNT